MRLALILATALAVTATELAAQEQQLSPYQWQQAQKVAFEKSEKVYAEALKRNGLLAQFKAMRDAYRSDSNKAFRIVFGQYMSWYQTFVGDYPGAHDAYSIRQLAASDDNSSPLSGGYTSKPALDEIVTIWPERCLRMTGRTARVTFIGPKRLVSNCRRICAGEISSK